MSSVPGTEPFHHAGGPTGIVVGHGFTGSPLSVRPWAEHLANRGYSVSLPLLAGHGTHYRDLEATRWEDWFADLDAAYLELRKQCTHVFAFGLSMGGALALRLAEKYPHQVAGLVLVNPSVGSRKFGPRLLARLPILTGVVRTSSGIGGDIMKPGAPETSYERVPTRAAYELTKLWRTVRAELAQVRAPVLVYRSQVDHIVDDLSVDLIRNGLVNSSVNVRVLEHSYHVATLDNDAPTVFSGSIEWIQTHSQAAPDPHGIGDTATDHGPGSAP